MNDLIYRKDVIEDYIAGFGLTIEDIEKIPAVEAEPVKHGKWIGVGEVWCESWTCSVCGGKLGKAPSESYCSHCGAKMDEAEE